ncbi:hypothetical protein Hanom_Chr04g00330641 [Helianthus anomalus]
MALLRTSHLVDDVLDFLALPHQLHDQIIIGHPEHEHLIDSIPHAAIPHVVCPPVIDLDDDDDDDIPVFHVDHPDEDSATERESVISSALWVVGLQVYPSDDASSTIPATSTPTPTASPTHISVLHST